MAQPLRSLFNFKKNRPDEMTLVPLAQRLLVCVDKVLSDWAQLTPTKVQEPGLLPEDGFIVLMAPLNGPRGGLFSVASTVDLGSLLAVSSTGDPSADSFGHEALMELSHRLRECVLQDALGMDHRDYLLHRPVEVGAMDLPAVTPTAALKVLVSGQPLELRLWLA